MNNMKNKITVSLIAALILAGGLVAFAGKAPMSDLSNVMANIVPTVENKNTEGVELNIAAATPNAPKTLSSPVVVEKDYTAVSPLQVVASPDKYLGKQIKFRAVFDKFSTLGLDYKPAMRDSQKYISFLIKRDDVTDHTIPLSEMKIFIKRSDAEKFIDLDSGDVIEVYGKVFSNALTDAWVDADKLVVITKKNKDKEKKV